MGRCGRETTLFDKKTSYFMFSNQSNQMNQAKFCTKIHQIKLPEEASELFMSKY